MSALKEWNELPEFMRIPEVRPYWDVLNKKELELRAKRLFDMVLSIILLILLAIPMIIIAAMIKADSKGSVLFRQERVTSYGKRFRIHKFRTMVSEADQMGTSVTVGNDRRITRLGAKLRKYRLDELPQIFDVLVGNMSFVGTRPEALRYVKDYKPAYYATLLLPAGITSEASIRFKDEDKMLENVTDVDKVYVEKILPEKMVFNLEAIMHFSLWREIRLMFLTVIAVFKKD